MLAIGLLTLILFGLHSYAESALKQRFVILLKEAGLEYGVINVNPFSRNAEITNLKYQLDGKVIIAHSLKLNSFNVYEYLVNGNFEFGEVIVSNPDFTISKSHSNNINDSADVKWNHFQKILKIEKLVFEEGSLSLFKDSISQNQFYSHFKSAEFSKVSVTSAKLEKQFPFQYQNYKLRLDSVYYKMNKEHDLTIGKANIQNGGGEIRAIYITPIYSKKDFHKHIAYRKDRIELEIPKLRVDYLQFKFENDSLWVQNPTMEIDDLKLNIFRDQKSIEDNRTKYLYSKLIRDIPIKLSLDTVKIENASITYEEKYEKSDNPGVVDFRRMYASIYNLSNIDMCAKEFSDTYIDMKTRFLGEADLQVKWHFNSSNRNDDFKISGNLGALSASNMNNFLKPAMNVEASGEIENMKFNFTGNNKSATGEVTLNYKDFKVEVLRKNSFKKNKVVSALANLIIKNKAVSEKAKVHKVEVERDRTKSFWNFLWKSIREGALKTFL